jgi:hypothetical protein
MSCEEIRARLVLAAEGREFEGHLRDCADCRRFSEELRLVGSAIANLPRPEPSEARVRRAVSAARPSRRVWLGAAAALVLAIGVAWMSGGAEIAPPDVERVARCHDAARRAPGHFSPVCARSTMHSNAAELQAEVRFALHQPRDVTFVGGHSCDEGWGVHQFFSAGPSKISLVTVRSSPPAVTGFQVFPLGEGRTRVQVVWDERPYWFALIADDLSIEEVRRLVESISPGTGS